MISYDGLNECNHYNNLVDITGYVWLYFYVLGRTMRLGREEGHSVDSVYESRLNST